MRKIRWPGLIALLLLSGLRVSAQPDGNPRLVDTFLSLGGGADLHDRISRTVPAYSKMPLYVEVMFPGGKERQWEFFRKDARHYLAYSYFYGRAGEGTDGLQSEGAFLVLDGIADSTMGVIDQPDESQQEAVTRLQSMVKDGPWQELDDSTFFTAYWEGSYAYGKRTGIWTHFVRSNTEQDWEMEQIDHGAKDPVASFRNNLGRSLPIEEVRVSLPGRWKPAGCGEDRSGRILFNKCTLYNGNYGGDCNDQLEQNDYLELSRTATFVNNTATSCEELAPSPGSGTWAVIQEGTDRILTLRSATGAVFRFRILFMSREDMVVDRI